MPSSYLNRCWQYPEAVDSQKIQAISSTFSLHPKISELLIRRNYRTDEQIQLFLNPKLKNLANPFLLKGMQKAVERVLRALSQKEVIVIYGDYDVDGTTGSSLLYLFLKEVGANVSVYIPHRVEEGYGLNKQAIEYLAKKNTSLIITVDNGVSATEEAEFALSLNLDLIIIDHHHVPPVLPQAHCIINPKQEDCDYPFSELAAVGVAFNFALALRSCLREQGFFKEKQEPDLKKYLDLVALGTIADMVPLLGQNRILVSSGLQALNNTQNKGVEALKKVSKIEGEITTTHVGFRLGPRINAAGRLESAMLGFELLTSEDSGNCFNLAQSLDEANQARQSLEKQTLEEAIHKIESSSEFKNRKSILVFDPSWHMGVVGIVASRLVEKYYVPAIVGVQEGELIRCSARSIPPLHLYDALNESRDCLEKFGGHAQAAGLKVQLSQSNQFWEVFDRCVREKLSEKDWVPQTRVDLCIEEKDLNADLLNQLEKLKPFGQGHPECVFLFRNLEVHQKQILKSAHLKLSLKFPGGKILEAIRFSAASWPIEEKRSYDFLGYLSWNEWNQTKKIQMSILDFR